MAAHLLILNALFFFFLFTFILPTLILPVSGDGHLGKCRSYCGNITVDYPFAVEAGCGHPGFRELLFCVNDVLMFHISSGSYRVLQIDYAYHSLILDDPRLSTCNSIVRGGMANGFVLETWRAPYLNPASDNAFMLIGCSPQSPLFQGFPGKHLPCRNVSGMGCEDYYDCPAWERSKVLRGTSPPQCCTVSFEAIRAINLTKLQCEGYSSAYNLAPLRLSGPSGWSYGIRVMYSVPGGDSFCQACESTGGVCGYHATSLAELCICGGSNSTSNCDTITSAAGSVLKLTNAASGFLTSIIIWMATMNMNVMR